MKRLIPTIFCALFATVACTGLYRPTGDATIPDTRVNMGKRGMLANSVYMRCGVCNIPPQH